ncbi:MAG: malto-oligosyltrehalose trehalohydrolase [Gemmatimonadales bacterium]
MTGWSLTRGASVDPGGGVVFEVWAPAARRVEVAMVGPGPTSTHPMEEIAGGVWSAALHQAAAGGDYVYRLDGGPGRPDPVSRSRPAGVHGPTRIVDPSVFAWSDAGWSGLAVADLVIYELHVGAFTPEGSFDGVMPRLEALRELGITAIELMPVAEFPGSRNWGYDGVSPYAPQSSYGGPDGLRRLVNAAHRAGLAVLLDVVYNHLGPEGSYLGGFGPYFSDRHRTMWGDGWNLDGAESDEVRRYLVDNARYWITEFHLDGLRLDAADKIVDLSALHILEELADAVHAQGQALGRRVAVIAESDANDPRYVRPPGEGGYGLDAQWSDDFHHAVHAALTGERAGYYADFGGIGPVAKALSERFVNDGRPSPFRRRRHGRPAAEVPADRFVICIQNHDQVGNRARGERLSALVSTDALKLGAAILLLSPYVPLLFMGEEYAESRPFLYFVSHGDPDLVEAVREGRRREFTSFASSGAIADPQAQTTFATSRLDWDSAIRSPHAEVRALYRDLLALRRSAPSLRPGAALPGQALPGQARVSVGHDEAGGWISLLLTDDYAPLLALFNFAAEERRVPIVRPEFRTLLLSTDAAAYGGLDRTRIHAGQATLPPLSAALLAAGPA